MVTLYGKNGACSLAVHVLLNEMNQPVNYISGFDANSKATPELLALNPLGQIPVIKDGDIVMTEGAAIMCYLMDKHQSPLLPKSGAEKAAALQWLAFANATMHPAYGRVFFLKGAMDDAAAKDKTLAIAVEKINQLWARVDAQLAKHRYIAGESVTGADILLTVIANWSGYVPGQVTFGANTTRLLKEISARPAFQKALAAESVTYQAAA